jgi:hypothetical protein
MCAVRVKPNKLRGEALRDVGILLLVFVPLDVMVQYGLKTWWESWLLVGAAGLSWGLIELGIKIEGK